ncbi:cytochrome P450 4V2-like [Anneissia japonica]|uniref:cytochrome P450 4V2-like n=1 Tax=Anneissia japonica TaxID=1529436 RepID=UPI0014256EFE|nr:cytochrome P450 4V2-like [Anneissia japonica]
MLGVGISFVSLSLIICLIFGGLVVLRPLFKTWQLISQLPGPKSHPLFGHAFQLEREANAFFMQIMRWTQNHRHFGLFRIWLGFLPCVLTFKAESVEPILKSNKHITKSYMYTFLHPWLGTGLLTSTGSKWQTRRKMLTPTFHFKILNDFMDVFNEQAEILVTNLEQKADGTQFNVFFLLTACVLDIICETAMGESVNAQSDMENEYVKAVLKLSELLQERQKSPWLWPDFIYNRLSSGKQHAECLRILHGMTIRVIEKHGAELREQLAKQKAEGAVSSAEPRNIGKRKRLAFLDLLLYMQNEDPSFTIDDIREEVDTFMFEGHDTTAAAANWAMYMLGSNPEAQKRLHEELDSVFGGSDRPVTTDDFKDLKYLECVVKETLRLFPSVPIFGRTADKTLSLNGCEIPEGTQAFVLTYALHRDERYFPEPEKFNPERFLPENSVDRHPFAYVPFSAGPRNCIGQRFAMFEEKVILAHIFRKFKAEAVQEFEDLKIHGEIVLRPSAGIEIKLTKRK